MRKNKPIGVLDSGIGGLTVVKEILNILPGESLLYLGDTARVPYGSRGKEVITKYALELTKFLLSKDVKVLVVACNTISSVCLSEIMTISNVPVLGVINPAAKMIARVTKTKKVGIIGTRALIDNHTYEKEIRRINPKIILISKPCPLFVPIVEEGLGRSSLAKLAAEEYLNSFKNKNIDVLHLGCTHYPLLKDTIQEVVGRDVILVDSAKPAAEELKKLLEEKDLINKDKREDHRFYFTDMSRRTIEIASLFLNENISDKTEKVNL